MNLLEFQVRYPFTSGAKKTIEENNVQINDRIIELALERIKLALTEREIPKYVVLHDNDLIEQIAGYAASRMILGYSRNRFLINRCAVAESKRVSGYLKSESEELLKQVANELGIAAVERNGLMFMPVYTYLKCSPRSIDYKLTNRELVKGYVKIKPGEEIRLIEEAVRKHMEKIPIVKSPPEIIKHAAESLKEFLPKIQTIQIAINIGSGDLPPCIEKLIDSIRKHENLPHQARWYLAVYLLRRGMPLEQIVSIYSNLPDYNEKITRYQLEHAKKKEYAVPACATILTWGLCCADCKIGSPLNWDKLNMASKENLLKTGRRS